MRFSVSLRAEGDRTITLAEVVELADAVAVLNGIASGAGSTSFGAQIVVEAADSDAAVEIAIEQFQIAASSAGMPDWPVAWAETISEIDELEALDP